MNISSLLGAVCAATLAVLVDTAHSSVVNPIFGLNIGGTLYDVTFHDSGGDSFDALWDADNDGVFGGGSSVFNFAPTFWGNEAGALAAATAIIAYLGDSNTPMECCTDSFLVPYTTQSGQLTSGTDNIISAVDIFYNPAIDLLSTTSLADFYYFITVTPYASFSPTIVPVPATVWLFGSGLLSLVGIARRKKTA